MAWLLDDLPPASVTHLGGGKDAPHQFRRETLDLGVGAVPANSDWEVVKDCQHLGAHASQPEPPASVDHDVQARRVAGEEQEQPGSDCLHWPRGEGRQVVDVGGCLGAHGRRHAFDDGVIGHVPPHWRRRAAHAQ